jgi:predicted dehydrogenase
VLADLGSHLIDLVLHLLGPVAWVSARTRTLVTERPDAAGNLSPVEGDDAAWLQLGLAQGGHGSVEVSKLVPGAGDDLRIEAYGTNGSLIYDARDPNGLLITEGAGAATERRVAAQSRTLPPASLPSPETPTGAVGWHLASIRAFLGAYVEGSTPSPSLIEGFEVDRVIAAARRSAADGGKALAI